MHKIFHQSKCFKIALRKIHPKKYLLERAPEWQ